MGERAGSSKLEVGPKTRVSLTEEKCTYTGILDYYKLY